MNNNTNSVLIQTCTILVLLAGCAKQQQYGQNSGSVYVTNATIPDAIKTTEAVLGRMHFIIEKSDANAGILRTRPLAGAQFFELWRSDNVGSFNFAESNIQSIRRVVELNFSRRDTKLLISCDVKTQRLSLPEHQVTSSTQAYRMYSLSTTSMQTLKLSPEQKKEMAWIDLGRDEKLAGVILEQIEQNLIVRSSE